MSIIFFHKGTPITDWIKGKVQASFKSIFMKRAIKYKQNSETLMKIGQRMEHFAKHQYDYACKLVSWWCHRLTTFHILNIKFLKFWIFALTYENLSLTSQYIWVRIILHVLHGVFEGYVYITFLELKSWIFVNFLYKINCELYGNGIINLLICIYLYRCSTKCLWKSVKIQKFHIILINSKVVQFIKFSPFCLYIFSLFIEDH